MYCPKCGKQLPDATRFCEYCGAPVYEDIPQDAVTQKNGVSRPKPAQRVYGAPSTVNRPNTATTQDPEKQQLTFRIIVMIGGLLVLIGAFFNRLPSEVTQYFTLIIVIQVALGAFVMLTAFMKKKRPSLAFSAISVDWTCFTLIGTSSLSIYFTGSAGTGPAIAFIGALMAFCCSFGLKDN